MSNNQAVALGAVTIVSVAAATVWLSVLIIARATTLEGNINVKMTDLQRSMRGR